MVQAADHGWNCTLRMVAFWINTPLPVFWITIGTPAAPLKAPLPIAFDPVTTWSTVLFATVPFKVMVSLTSLPPLDIARVLLSALRPHPSSQAGWAEGAAAVIAGTRVPGCVAAALHVNAPSSNIMAHNMGLTVRMVILLSP
jgi:hypothetical protein